MANLYKRPNSPYWWMRFQVKGKAYGESTGLKATKDNRAKAERVMAQRIAEVKNPLSIESLTDNLVKMIKGLPDAEQSKQRRKAVKRIMGDKVNRLEIGKAWAAWRDDPEASKTEEDRTLDAYEGRFRAFVRWLKDSHAQVKYVDEVTRDMARGYAIYLRGGRDIGNGNGQHVSRSTYGTHMKLLRRMFAAFERMGAATENVFDRIDTKGAAPDSKRPLTADEMGLVFDHAAGKGNLQHWFMIGYYTGLRLGDVVTLRWSELDIEAGQITRLPLKRRNAADKEKATVTIPMHPALQQHLAALKAEASPGAEYVFPADAERYWRDGSAVVKEIQKHFIDCGIDVNKPGTGKQIVRDARGNAMRDEAGRVKVERTRVRGKTVVGFHSLRHSFVSLLAAESVPEVAAMALVGHGSPAMTRHYSHAGNKVLKDAIATLKAPTVPKRLTGRKRTR